MMTSKFLFLTALFLCTASLINAANIAISVNDFNFGPANQQINVGDTVTWTWTGAAQHSVTQGTGCTKNGFDSGLKTTGTFQFTFNTAGTINYFCSLHCAGGMVATLTVNAAAGNTTTTTTTTPASTTSTTTTAAATTTTTTSTTIVTTSTPTATTQAPVSGGGPIHYVAVSNNQFTPSNLIINPGDTVVFYLVAGFHNVISTTGVGSCKAATGATAILASNGTSLAAATIANYSVTLNKPGIYPYMCQYHCALQQMYGQISVAYPVSVNNYVFTPSTLNINAGESVVFYLISGFHNVISTTAAASCTAATGAAAVLASSGASLSSATTANYTVTLTKAGVYPYMCQYHCAAPNNMYAQINVLGGAGGNNGAFKATQMNLAAIIGLAIAMAVGAMHMQQRA